MLHLCPSVSQFMSPLPHPSDLDLAALLVAVPYLAFHLCPKDLCCQMSKHFHHRLALHKGTLGLFLLSFFYFLSRQWQSFFVWRPLLILGFYHWKNVCIIFTLHPFVLHFNAKYDRSWFVSGALPPHVMTSSRVYSTCVRHSDSFHSTRQSFFMSRTPNCHRRFCEWHVSLHLARTCIAYGDCITARGSSGVVLRHDSNTWGGKWEEAGKRTRLRKSIKDG